MHRASRRLPTVLGTVLTLGVAACGEKPRPPEVVARPERPPSEPLDPMLFDARGMLRTSDVTAFTVPIPVGLEKTATRDHTQIFSGVVPIGAVQAYFRSKLVGSDISEAGSALHFRGARLVSTGGVRPERYDVSVGPMPNGVVQVEITERVVTTPTVSEDEMRRQMVDAWRRQD